MPMRQWLLTVTVTLFFSLGLAAQEAADGRGIAPEKAAGFLNSISNKFSSLSNSLSKKTEQYLNRLEKQEAKLYQKLYRKDSAAAKKLFAANTNRYQKMRDKLQRADSANGGKHEYSPYMDTLKTSLSFIEKGITKNNRQQFDAARKQLQQYEGKLQVANEIKKQLRERKQVLEQNLEKYGMAGPLAKMNKEVYYYQQQLNEYKQILSDRSKAEQKLLQLLRNNPSFENFFARNSILGQIFPLQGNGGEPMPTPTSLTGFQTRASIQLAITARTGNLALPQQLNQQQMTGSNPLQLLKDRAKGLAPSGNSQDMMPGFKPNSQRTKSFWKRLEYGFNYQVESRKGILPTRTDIGLSVGYKLNDASVLGIGVNYKLGLGKKITDLHLTHQGIGLRSYLDIKLKKKLWISGGYELNYFHEFRKFQDIANVDVWQRSFLLGASRKFQVSPKKTVKMQVLYDFLYSTQSPRGNPVVFRMGWNF